MKTERDRRFDIAKGLAMLCIIAGHMGFSGLNKIIYIFHVPIFFIISGYFFNKDKNLGTYVMRMLKFYFLTVIMIIVADSGFYTVKGLIKHEFDVVELINKVRNWLVAGFYGSGYRHDFLGLELPSIGAIWFLLALLLSVILLRVIIRFIPQHTVKQCIVVVLVFAIGVIGSRFIWLPFSIWSACAALPFLYCGFLLRQKGDFNAILKNKLCVACTICLFAISIFINFHTGKYLGLVSAEFPNGIFDITGALAGCFLILYVASLMDKQNKLGGCIAYLGRNSILILCFHLVEYNTFPWYIVRSLIGTSLLSSICILCLKWLFAVFTVIVVNNIKPLKKLFS